MKLSKILGVAAFAALALMAFASTASATTLETNGVTQSGGVTIKSTASSTITLESTSGVFSNTCSTSTVEGTTSVTSGTTVSGSISALSFSNCTHSPVVVVSKGSLSVERIGTTTNGTVRSSGAEVTVPVTIFGSVVSTTCKTNNTDIGTLTGSSVSGGSKITLSAILECGGVLPSARWTGTYTITGHGIGVVA
jgi:hypothetical protein